jgi:excisionase family DNA binding protein
MSEAIRIQPIGLSIDEVSQATGLGRSTIYKEIAEGRLRTYKVGRRRLATPQAVEAWAKAHEARIAG